MNKQKFDRKKLAALRESKGFTRYHLIQELKRIDPGLNGHSLYQWEKGICNPSVKYMQLLCDYFKVNLSHFFS